MKCDLKIIYEINVWISIHAVDVWRGNTTGCLVVRGMSTSLVTVCIRRYKSRPFCYNGSKLSYFMTHPRTQTFHLSQPLTLGHVEMDSHHPSSYSVSHTCSLSHSHPLMLIHFHCQGFISLAYFNSHHLHLQIAKHHYKWNRNVTQRQSPQQSSFERLVYQFKTMDFLLIIPNPFWEFLLRSILKADLHRE